MQNSAEGFVITLLRLAKTSAGGKTYAIAPARLTAGWRLLWVWAPGQPAGWIATMLADTAPEGEQPMMLRTAGRVGGLRIGLTFVRLAHGGSRSGYTGPTGRR